MNGPRPVRTSGQDALPPHGLIALPPDFFGVLEDPLKGLLMDKGAAEVIAQVDARVVDLWCHADALVERVRAENERHRQAYLALTFVRPKLARWRCLGSLVKLVAEMTGGAVQLDRYFRHTAFETTWEHYELVDSVLRQANPALHRFYRAIDFAAVELESRFECYRSLRESLVRVDDCIARKSRMTLKEREIVAAAFLKYSN